MKPRKGKSSKSKTPDPHYNPKRKQPVRKTVTVKTVTVRLQTENEDQNIQLQNVGNGDQNAQIQEGQIQGEQIQDKQDMANNNVKSVNTQISRTFFFQKNLPKFSSLGEQSQDGIEEQVQDEVDEEVKVPPRVLSSTAPSIVASRFTTPSMNLATQKTSRRIFRKSAQKANQLLAEITGADRSETKDRETKDRNSRRRRDQCKDRIIICLLKRS
jgi:hypothetical protein